LSTEVVTASAMRRLLAPAVAAEAMAMAAATRALGAANLMATPVASVAVVGDEDL